jgi:hypothetical protein
MSRRVSLKDVESTVVQVSLGVHLFLGFLVAKGWWDFGSWRCRVVGVSTGMDGTGGV